MLTSVRHKKVGAECIVWCCKTPPNFGVSKSPPKFGVSKSPPKFGDGDGTGNNMM